MKFILTIICSMMFAATAFAQTSGVEGTYFNTYQDGNQIMVRQLNLVQSGNSFSGQYIIAKASGIDEFKHAISGVVVDKNAMTISFQAEGKTWNGILVPSCTGKFSIALNAGEGVMEFKNAGCN